MAELPSFITTTFKQRLLPTHSFISPKLIPLKPNTVFTPTPTFSSTLASLSVKCLRSQLLLPKPFASQSQRPPVGELSPKVYVGYTVYTRKGVLTMTPRPPKYEPKDSGAFKVAKEGYVLLQFAPSVDTDSSQYDWNKKQVFSLSVSEMGALISLGARDSCEFFHDSFKPESDEVEVRKVLKVEPLLDDTGHLFNLSIQNKFENVEEIQESIFIPVIRAELAVFRSIFNYIMPYLLGWHAFTNSIKPEVSSRVNSANSRYRAESADYE